MYDLRAFAVSLQLLLAALFVERSLRLVIENRGAARLGHAVVPGVIAGLLLIVVLPVPKPAAMASFTLPILFLVMIFAFGQHLVFAHRLESAPKSTSWPYAGVFVAGTPGARQSPLLTAYYRSRVVRTILGLALGFKLFCLVALGWWLRPNQVILFPLMDKLIMIILATPVMLFNYLFSNAFGHHASLWHTLHLQRGDFAGSFGAYLRLLAFPLFIDFAMSLGGLTAIGWPLDKTTYLYLATLFSLVPIGFLGSVTRPVRVQFVPSLCHMYSNVSLLVSLGLAVPVAGVLAVFLETRFFHVVALLINLLLWCILFVFRSTYRHAKHRVFAHIVT